MSHFINLLDILYPIGSLYFSFQDVNPASIIGGSWIKLENKVIRAGNDTDIVGEDTHKLTISEMPQHQHYISGGVTNPAGYLSAMGDHYGIFYDGGYTDFQGGNLPHNNLPKCQNVHVWYRTS